MAEKKGSSSTLIVPVPTHFDKTRAEKPLPSILQAGTRGADTVSDPFLASVRVEESYPLAAVGRGETPKPEKIEDTLKLLALEAADGTTVFIRADRLQEEIERLCPDAVSAAGIDLSRFRDREAATRGGMDWLWSKLSVLSLDRDAIIDAAIDKALEWAQDWLGEKLPEAADLSASALGAKALMWAIESRLAGKPGLYQWRNQELAASDRCERDDRRLVDAAKEGPLLVFIHGTGSHTVGSFKDLRAPSAPADWEAAARRFGERVFGFEHRTFSESPIDNALALADVLPVGARVCLVTHSRGGLVGDLFCMGELTDDLISAYRRDPPANAAEADWQVRLREKVAAEEQRKLRQLRSLLSVKKFQIDRYVRVAAPARGTALLSDNLEVFLSGLLSLMGKLVGAVAGPAGSAVFSAFKRVVLEIADKRVDARLVPGIEAMLSDAPMGVLLARAPSRQDVEMAVIAGDIEGGGIAQRLGVLFTDWMFFDRADNDLVVDTASMYAGLARSNRTRYLYDQGERVNHFSYFDNRPTRRGLLDWLTSDSPHDLSAFDLLVEGREPTVLELREKARTRGEAIDDKTRPLVIVLPGIMGSHLELRAPGHPTGDRVWFDLPDLIAGGLGKIRYGAANVHPEALFEMFYGDLCDYLQASHTVIRFPYDWRKPIQETADLLAQRVQKALDDNKEQPLRLLAHSMGGLVVRAMIAEHPDLWNDIVARPGGRFIMLGTPNNGSHLMVESLLGKSETVRNLARLDIPDKLQGVLDIIAAFPGALQLLPRPGFQDSGGAQEPDYFVNSALWEGFRQHNKDRWFGNGVVGVPPDDTLQFARSLWDANALGMNNEVPDPGRVAYVFGQSDNTPCGLKLEGDRLKMIGTTEGDGSVSWASGRLENLPKERCWYMPVAHGNLADSDEHFPALVDLLQSGETDRLGRLPVSRGAAATRTYDAGPAPYPTQEEVTRSLVGAKPKQRKARVTRHRLAVSVAAMDLRFAHLPVMCGHYIGDPIAGAEAQIDRVLVDGALSQRERLGIYAGEIGTCAVALHARSAEDVRRGTGRGAVIVGLGEYGKLTVGDITETVRAGVLRFLLHTCDRSAIAEAGTLGAAPTDVGLGTLLIGYNSTANISVDDSVAAIVRGVCVANRQFEDAMGPKARVGRLEFVELFLDNAITAANAVRALPQRLERELQRLSVTLDATHPLSQREGARYRLSVASPFCYWPRLMVTDADRMDDQCPPECYRIRHISPIPEDVLRELLEEDRQRREPKPDHAAKVTPRSPGAPALRTALATRLKYVYLAERARAEAEFHQRQPGLIEALVRNAIHVESYNPDLARTLFQLMVPLDLKAAARDTERLVLMLDGYTANLPWEMLQADEEPMVRKTRVVRQLVSARFRKTVHPSTSNCACIITDPSTEGFQEHFGRAQPLPRLPGAVEEANAVHNVLTGKHYDVEFVPSESRALDVISRLMKRPYRILVIAAHGEFELTARDGSTRSGVVLSDGIVLTAAEIGQLEVVPDLAFLNCCHLGKIDAAPAYNRLAYSLARELIEMGVRCVVVAGWKVNDLAACTFAETFFAEFVQHGRPFGDACYEARRETFERHPGCNTWGAYQAYGDPGFVLEPLRGERPSCAIPVASEELVADLNRLRLAARAEESRDFKTAVREARNCLRNAPPEWSELPEVQFALGALYGEFGAEGFELASAAYERAIGEDDKAGRVPVKAIEQLAELEGRTGESFGGAKGLALVDRSIDRLQKLLDCTQRTAATVSSAGGMGAPLPPVNAGRWSLLGSGWKHRAALLASSPDADWGNVKAALERSREAYLQGSGWAPGGVSDPSPVLNRLQLDGLLQNFDPGHRSTLVQLATRCADLARERFRSSFDFLDAVMAADAELATRMIDRSVKDTAGKLVQAYLDAVARMPKSTWALDLVGEQLRVLASFYRARGAGDDAQSADALTTVANTLAPGSSATASAGTNNSAAPPERPPSSAAVSDSAPAAPVTVKRKRPRSEKAREQQG